MLTLIFSFREIVGRPIFNLLMAKRYDFWAVLLLLICVFALNGCSGITPEESQLPWSEPKSWEGGVPGFGSGDSLNREY